MQIIKEKRAKIFLQQEEEKQENHLQLNDEHEENLPDSGEEE